MRAKMGVRWDTEKSKVGFLLTTLPSSFENVAGKCRLETAQTDQEYLGDPQAHLNSQQSNFVQKHKPHNSFGRFRPKDDRTAVL
jgi:hypothetical protein